MSKNDEKGTNLTRNNLRKLVKIFGDSDNLLIRSLPMTLIMLVMQF